MRDASMSDPLVDDLACAVYSVPTDQAEADGTTTWESTTCVTVEVTAGGHTGLGYTYGPAGCAHVVKDQLREVIMGRPAFAVPGSWEAMVRRCRNTGRPGLVSMAIAAVDSALWDLVARLLDLPLASVLGRARETVPVYGSGGFTTYDEAGPGRSAGALGGGSGYVSGQDQGRGVVGSLRGSRSRSCHLHPSGGGRQRRGVRRRQRGLYTRTSRSCGPRLRRPRRHLVRGAGGSSDDLVGLAQLRVRSQPTLPLGSTPTTSPTSTECVEAEAVDCMQLDVTRIGGVTEWRRAAAAAAGDGLEVSGHCAPALHAHVAASVSNLRHVEYFHDHARLEASAVRRRSRRS